MVGPESIFVGMVGGAIRDSREGYLVGGTFLLAVNLVFFKNLRDLLRGASCVEAVWRQPR
jgi:hypothetical protein